VLSAKCAVGTRRLGSHLHCPWIVHAVTTKEGMPQVGSRGSDEQGGVYERSMQRSGVDVSRLRVEDGSTGERQAAAQWPPLTPKQLPECACAHVLSLAVPPGVHDADT